VADDDRAAEDAAAHCGEPDIAELMKPEA